MLLPVYRDPDPFLDWHGSGLTLLDCDGELAWQWHAIVCPDFARLFRSVALMVGALEAAEPASKTGEWHCRCSGSFVHHRELSFHAVRVVARTVLKAMHFNTQ